MTFLFDKDKLSEWAYYYCKDIKDDPEVRKNITNYRWAYEYCSCINDDPEVKIQITHSFWAYLYCIHIKNDPELRKKNGLNETINNIFKSLNNMSIELLDKKYKGGEYIHNFRCTICGDEFKDKYANLKKRKIICYVCWSDNPMLNIKLNIKK